jgi:intracellular multiplication protein IcmL
MIADSVEKNAQDDALIMVHFRNQFYKKKFRFSLFVLFLNLITIAVLIGVLVYLLRNPTRPLYFPTDDVSRLIQYIPINVPNMSTDDVAAWTIDAVENTLSYDFVNYRLQIQNSQKYFNEVGWRNYMAGLTKSNNLLALTQRKYIVIAKVVDKPKLKVEGMLAGAYAYKFELPVLFTYLYPPFDDKSKFTNAVYLDVVVMRQDILSSYKGLAIAQMIGNLAMGTEQNLSLPPPS